MVVKSVLQKFTFGKHNGKTVKQVLREDAQYILWAVNNEVIVLDNEIKDDVIEKAYKGSKNSFYALPDDDLAEMYSGVDIPDGS